MRRLMKILKFAKKVGLTVDKYFVDISQLTLLKIREKELKIQGKQLMDIPEFKEYEVIHEVRSEVCLRKPTLDEMKNLTDNIRNIKDQINTDLKQTEAMIRKGIAWKNQFKRNEQVY